MDHRELTRTELDDLADEYWYKEEFQNYDEQEFTHRLDKTSTKYLYALLRRYKPKVCLEFGTSWGGSACTIISALQKNGGEFQYIGFEKVDDLRRETQRNISRKCNLDIEIGIDIMQELDKIPQELDFVFIDPDWERDIAEWTFENIIPRIKKDGLVCIHDWSVDRDLNYGGGSFEGIKYFIEMFKEGKMPLEKLFSVWDNPDFRSKNIALSFWRKT